jgi:16S rRNA A1518/A1519 N6-dimethyltransferase RsmA/KsgA/DIM1 with predicted DNA glycosylase/AP lyase activity
MTKDTMYYFHQTPRQLAKQIINDIDFKNGENVLEPFKGDGAFYDQLPSNVNKYYTEIEEGLCYTSFNFDEVKINTIISNPPFKIDSKNCFFKILEYFSSKDIDRIIFLCNDYCFNSLTPKRLKKLNDNKLYLNKIVTCDVKKWRGRYYIITFGRIPNLSFQYFLNTFE